MRKVLQACWFPNWALNQLHQKFLNTNQPNNDTGTTTPIRIPITPTTPKTGTLPLWSLTSKEPVKSSKDDANPKVYRFILKVLTHSGVS